MKPKSFAEWAAAGGHVPKGVDPKKWGNTVKKYAEGGEVEMQAGGLLRKAIKSMRGTQEVLPQAQREANLQKMLEPSKVQQRLYHGTTATEGGKRQEAIRRMKPSKEGALGSGAYLTPNPKFAGEYAAESGGNMLPVYAQIKNPLMLEGKGDPMIEALVKLGVDEATAGKMVERAYETKGYIGREVESRARAAGYDGLMQYRDGNLTEVVSYNPNAIKSATGNVGTYDVTSPDMSKADGGEVKMQDGGAAFGVFPQMRPRRSKQDREAAKTFPIDVARGVIAGTLGAPGDIESIVRLPYELITNQETKTFFPTSDEIERRLPLRSDTPAARFASGIGQLAGGAYTGPGSGVRAVTAVPKAVVKAGKDFVMAAPQGAPRMFIGPKAKTWDQVKADRAAQMEKEGKDPVDIWRETGTFRSADGILRQEISDVGAVHRGPTQLKELGKQKKEQAQQLQQRIAGTPGQKDMFPKALTEAKRPARAEVKRLKEEADELNRYSDVRGQRAKFALEHPELYRAYPELSEITVYQGNRGLSGERASIMGGPQDLEMSITQSGLRGDPRSSALHEMQHAIQTIEGMGPGGNPTMAFADPRAHDILKRMREEFKKPLSFEEFQRGANYPEDEAAAEYAKYVQRKEFTEPIHPAIDRELQQQAAMEYYRRLAGEAESRATQAREPLTQSQRAMEFPYSSYDVLPEDLIVKPAKSFKEGGAAFGVFPQMRGRRSKQDPEAAKTFPIDVARGFVSGALGMPGDIESLVRMLPGFSEKTILPTSEDIERRLPLRSDTPAARAATGMGQIGGGFYTGPLSGARAAVAVPRAVGRAGRDFVQAAGQPAVNVIKPKGGNWLTGSVERAVAPLKPRNDSLRQELQDNIKLGERFGDQGIVQNAKSELAKMDAVDQWIDRNLTNYIKKEMATPEDPVRLLIERRQAEVEGKYIKDQERAQRMADRAAAETDPRRQANLSRQAQQMRDEANLERELGLAHLSHLPSGFGENSQLASYIRASRESRGFPREGMAQTPSSKIWENLSDEAIVGARPSEISPASRNLNPWIEKLDPNESVYRTSQDIRRELGFDHVVDVLKQDLAAGRINPEQLSKVSMEQAVRRTAEFDQDMAKRMRDAQIKVMEGMPVHKEYPEGYKWIELTTPKGLKVPEGYKVVPDPITNRKTGEVDPNSYRLVDQEGRTVGWGQSEEEAISAGLGEKVLKDALKYEGDTMGHCVGGYCPDVLAGRSRIYSLRDARGEPHVTIEVRPNRNFLNPLDFAQSAPPSLKKRIDEADAVKRVNTRQEFEELVRNSPEYQDYLSRTSPQEIVQIKGKQNRAPKEEYLPFVQDFVRGGNWNPSIGDFQNTGLYRKSQFIDEFTPEQLDIVGSGEYLTMSDIQRLREGKPWKPIDTRPDLDINIDGMKAGGEVKMQAGGIAKTLKNLIGSSAKEVGAAERAAAGRMAADVTKATQPMKMSEALGNLNVEGKGRVKITQSDRTRVGGGNIGGAMFPGLSQVNPLYEGLVWGVGKKPTASGLINQSDDLTYWTTILGAEDQLKTNPIVFNKLRQGFVDAMKQGKLDKELEGKINRNLSLTFGEGAEIRDPKIWQKADTFEKRAALADVMLGQGIPPSKGGVALGGEKSGKGVIFRPTDILKRETEPLLMHPEHGGTVPTFAVGPRLFQFSGGMQMRPDLHPGFPVLLEGQDLGMVFRPAPGEVAMRDFTQRMMNERGRKPGYYEWTMGEKGKGLPSQDITEEYLTHLQKAGYAEGGKVSGLSAIEKV